MIIYNLYQSFFECLKMALIRCYDCGAKVSLQGDECKKCGAPLDYSIEMYEYQKQRKSHIRGYVIGVLAILIGIATLVNGGFLAFLILTLAGLLIIPATNQMIENFNPYDTGGLLKGIGWVLLVLGFIMAMGVIAKHNAENPAPTSAPIQAAPAQTAPKQIDIDPHAFTVYTKEAYPKMYAKYGDEGLRAFTEHDANAGFMVAGLAECDRVEYVGYSEQKSNYPTNLVSFVDCSNNRRFYVANEQVLEVVKRNLANP